ncbi:cell death abnormality protein 1-like [Haliotis cracherodii]|uniref:cell death abnormality protein 1-like n=1 Tax=Haliotis cracherodii TaxID=6455 RepID=UPI0039E7D6C0
MECNCKNASDCLRNPRKCPSGCAVGYTGKNYGCEKNEVTPASTLENERSTAGETTSPPEEPTNGCSGDKYGIDCQKTCSSGCVWGGCNSSTGECLGGSCKPGWTNKDSLQRCDQECPEGSYGDNCVSTCSPGCRVFPCDRKTGKCSYFNRGYCQPGWTSRSSYPNRCDRCNVGYYGDGQVCTRCGAGCDRRCDDTDGHCTCKTGWTGTRCKNCEGGYYMDRRDCVVCGAGCQSGTCNANTGTCSCMSGWKGDQCTTRCASGRYGIDCKQTCSSGCKSGGCNSSTGECRAKSCKSGWRSTGARRLCDEECPEGSYGDNCVSTCSPGCRVFPCDRKTGKCSYFNRGYCQPGWTSRSSYPNRCDRCNVGYYGDGQVCTRCGAGCDRRCDDTDGHCTCKTGWTGTRCKNCEGGYYMDRRDCVVCGAGCQSGTCNANTGTCSCMSGWKGDQCTTRCASGRYGIDCKQTCSSGCKSGGCNSSTGECRAKSCKSGWRSTGARRLCDEECPEGSYGDNCVSTCSPGCRVFPCDRKTGKCSYFNRGYCQPGWTSRSSYPNRCDRCSVGYYGDGQVCTRCGAGCDRRCDDTDGHCTCKTGWTGTRCKSCSVGHYGDGQDCTQCGAGCNGGCDGTDGSCTCITGWTGNRCNNCKGGYYMDRRDCVVCGVGCQSGTCNANTGTCSCMSGWKGDQCTTQCWKRQYGPGCRKLCRRECLSCHHVTGSCAGNCTSGWHGENCTSKCRPGTYGKDCMNQCNEGCQPEKCDSIDGRCGTSCRSGWTGENCVDVCSPGAYGENCELNCSRGCVNQTCDRTTGRCDMCLDGWEHKDQNTSRCDKECDDGRYGEQCNDECSIHCVNAECHHVNGSCTHGCLDGGSGEYCEVSEAEHQNVNLIVGLVLFLIAVVAVVMCAVVYFREPLRRLRGKKTGEDMTNGLSFPMAAREGQGASENGAVYDDDEAIYINVPSSVPVAVSGLKDFVAKKKATKEILVKEYAELPKGLTAIHDKALTQVNSPKNRFKGIYPYNHSLVVLKGPSGSTGYINASFIDGPTRAKQYIATQGPLPHTVVDFWEMIWQQNVPVIVMLANIIEDGRRRCEPYWPNEPGEDSKTFGPWKITVADSCPLADFTIRTLKMRKGAAEKTVKHVHYMVWPDKDVPDNTMSLVDLRNKVRTFCDFAEGPMVVHCSAGVGRTGTLIALDSLIEDAETRSKVDIYGCVWRLRNFRVSMVQTQSQYVFLHDCILDALCHTVHPTPASFYDNAYKQLKRNSGIAVAYQKLSECPVTDHLSDAARDLENINKNRSEDILPGDKHRTILSSHIAGGTDYINAVIAPSYEKRKAFILTQIPLTSTVVDFWRLVHDYDIRGIVLLENYTDLDAKCGVFWAKNNKPTKFGPFSVSEGKTEKQTGFTMEKISYSLGTEEKDVTVFRSSAWPQKSSLPESPSSLLSLIDFLRQWNTGTSPLLVVCRDGATRSGLFCVVASAVQRLLLEKEVALQQTIRSIRFVRKQVIPNREQFEFCFDSLKVYKDSFQEYSNFA